MITFVAENIPADGRRAIPAGVMVPTKLRRLLVSPSIAAFFVIERVHIGRDGFVDAPGAPADIFVVECAKCGRDKLAAELDWGDLELKAGDTITLTVHNLDCAASRSFRAAIEDFPIDERWLRERSKRFTQTQPYVADVRTVARAVQTLRNPEARWPETAREVADALQAMLEGEPAPKRADDDRPSYCFAHEGGLCCECHKAHSSMTCCAHDPADPVTPR